MIELITGLPGNGKTLYTISMLKKRAEQENRPVFYHGIPELTLNWEHLEDPRTWASCPPNSIVVIDEAQKIFRNRSMGATPPQFVQDLETHRHLGIDLVLITQHPSLVDPSVRRLAGRHWHLIRLWGTEASTVHRWDAVKDNCDKSRTDSEKTKWAFDKSIYSLYKSAEVHTVKRSIPYRVKMVAVLIVLVIGLLAYVGNFMKKKITGERDDAPVATSVAGAGQVAAASSPASPEPGYANPVDDAKRFLWERTPRLEGLPETSPRYDQLTQATRVPIPAICIQKGSVRDGGQIDCKCFTQQATPMEVEFNTCMSIARNGRFMDFDPEPQRQQEAQAQRSVQVMNQHPDVPMRDTYGAPRVVAFDEVQAQLSGGMRPRTDPNNGPPTRFATVPKAP